MVFVEPSFPRGGRYDKEGESNHKNRKKISSKKHFKKRESYGATTSIEEKKYKPTQRERQKLREEINEKEKDTVFHSVVPLNYSTIEEGMLLMGCIYKIQNMSLKISLPGRLYGSVSLTSISKSFTNLIRTMVDQSDNTRPNKPLNEMFHLGDIVYVKVMEKSPESLTLSLNPSDLHFNFHHKQIRTGIVLCTAVEEIEDHVYTMETGVKNLRAILPIKNIPDDLNLTIGELVYCRIEKVTHTATSSVAILKALKQNEPRTIEVEEDDEIILNTIVPTTSVKFTVEQVLNSGLQGKIFDDKLKAYIADNQLTKPLSKLDDYSLYKMIDAKILYTTPITKFIFLTINSQITGNRYPITPALPNGTIIEEAKVIRKSPHTISFHIDKASRGIIPIGNILHRLQSTNYDVENVLSKYQPGSKHRVRTVAYYHIDRVYICTDDEKDLSAEYFTANDLQVGSIYDAKITKELHKNAGYGIRIANVKGFITKFDLNRGRQYNLNDTVKVKLMQIKDDGTDNVQVTNRPEFLCDSIKVLQHRKDVIVGRSFTGIVDKEMDCFFIVRFFNHISGAIFKRNSKQLKPGDVRLFAIKDVQSDGRIELILGEERAENLGEIYTAKITGIFATGIDIKIKKFNKIGTIPINYLSDFSSSGGLCSAICNSYDEGDKIKVVNINSQTFSVRDIEYYQVNTDLDFESVKIGDLLRAQIIQVQTHQITVQVLLKDYKRFHKFDLKDIVRDDEENCAFVVDQIVYVRILGKEVEPTRYLNVSIKLEDIFANNFDGECDYVEKYLKENEMLKKRYENQNKLISTFVIGKKISGKFENIIESTSQIVIKITNENDPSDYVYGICDADDETEFVAGDKINGKIIWIDYEKKLLQICKNSKHLKNIRGVKSIDDIDYEKKYKFCKLFSNQFIQIGYLKNTEFPLCIVPVRCHYNDFTPQYIEGKGKVVPVKIIDGLICAFEENVYGKIQALKAKKLIPKIPKKSNVIMTRSKGPVAPTIKHRKRKFIQENDVKKSSDGENEFEDVGELCDESDSESKRIRIEQFDGMDDVQSVLDQLFYEQLDGAVGYQHQQDNNEIKKIKKKKKIKETFEISQEESPVKEKKKKKKNEEKFHETEEIPTNETPKKKKKKNKQQVMEVDSTQQQSPEKKKKKKKIIENSQNHQTTPEKKSHQEIAVKTPEEKKAAKKQKKLEAQKLRQQSLTPEDRLERKRRLRREKRKRRAEAKRKLKAQNLQNNLQQNFNNSDEAKNAKKKEKKKLKNLKKVEGKKFVEGGKIQASKNLNGKVQVEIKSPNLPKSKNKKKKKRSNSESSITADEPKIKKSKTILPGADDFWQFQNTSQNKSDSGSSSDDDDADNLVSKSQKRKSAAERFQAMKAEEDRIRKIESELADPTAEPHTPDHFDRLVISTPNSSLLWIKYMIFYMESAEIDKARSIAQRALKTINFREEEERLNVWIALMNLEIRYGSTETYKNTLQEALQVNDQFKVYSQTIEVLIDVKKATEIQEIINSLCKKFKQNSEMWILIARAYYEIEMIDKAKQQLDRALKSLRNDEHIPLIVKFAFLHNKYGQKDQAHILFEQILTSYPKRTDIWSQYVDMLVKDGKIDLARQILERAIAQRLPMRKMKTLFTKFVQFEERHGDEKAVKNVKKLAAEYVKSRTTDESKDDE
uniref:Putative nucleus n=1 Tax=Corethrella appendiculata TaxID=1370023 RepID=W4VR54_9DIPT